MAKARPAALLASLVGLSPVVVFFACTSTYGEAPSPKSTDAGNGSTTPPPVDPGTSSSGGFEGGVVVVDAASDGPLVGAPCPACPGGATCVAAGCVASDSTPTSCPTPKSVGASTLV